MKLPLKATITLVLLLALVGLGYLVYRYAGNLSSWTAPYYNPNGIWVVDKAESTIESTNSGAADIPIYQPPFIVDDNEIVIRLEPHKSWDDMPPNNLFRLKAKWKGNEIFYLSPQNTWEKYASFINGRFEEYANGVVWKYKRVTPDELPLFWKDFLNDVPSFRYAFDAMTLRDEDPSGVTTKEHVAPPVPAVPAQETVKPSENPNEPKK